MQSPVLAILKAICTLQHFFTWHPHIWCSFTFLLALNHATHGAWRSLWPYGTSFMPNHKLFLVPTPKLHALTVCFPLCYKALCEWVLQGDGPVTINAAVFSLGFGLLTTNNYLFFFNCCCWPVITVMVPIGCLESHITALTGGSSASTPENFKFLRPSFYDSVC